MAYMDKKDFCELWAAAVGVAVGQVTGTTVSLQANEGTSMAESDAIWVSTAVSGVIAGHINFQVKPSSFASLISNVSPEQVRLVFEDASLSISQELKEKGVTIELAVTIAENPPSWRPAYTSVFSASSSPSTPVVDGFIDSELVQSIEAAQVNLEPPAEIRSPNLSMILDVELEVTLRFGKRTLPLSEVINLSPGAVIELDKQVNEPVELLLNNRIIANGEVVVVDGNYGLRVTNIPEQISLDSLTS